MANTDSTEPLYETLRKRALQDYATGGISYATLQNVLRLAQIYEADITQRNISQVATNADPTGDIHHA